MQIIQEIMKFLGVLKDVTYKKSIIVNMTLLR